MKKWNKKPVSREEIQALHKRFGVDALTASILTRRGLTAGKDIMYFLEDDGRFLHNPFLFTSMEDAVDRITEAKDEGEKVLIFGDRDVDGISSTAVLYEYLSNIGMDVQWKLPAGDDTYGLSIATVAVFQIILKLRTLQKKASTSSLLIIIILRKIFPLPPSLSILNCLIPDIHLKIFPAVQSFTNSSVLCGSVRAKFINRNCV